MLTYFSSDVTQNIRNIEVVTVYKEIKTSLLVTLLRVSRSLVSNNRNRAPELNSIIGSLVQTSKVFYSVRKYDSAVFYGFKIQPIQNILILYFIFK